MQIKCMCAQIISEQLTKGGDKLYPVVQKKKIVWKPSHRTNDELNEAGSAAANGTGVSDIVQPGSTIGNSLRPEY